MRMRKKGALELSINAIVILILAITMLGLGLGFMKKTFGGVTAQFGEVSEQMKKEMIDRLKDSASKVMLNVYEVEMKTSEKKDVYLAIKNEADSDGKFEICTKNSGLDATCDSYDDNTETPNTLCTYIAISGVTIECSDIVITTFNDKTIKRGEIEVLPVKVEVKSGAKATTYMVPILVLPPAGGTGSTPQKVDLYVTVK